MEHEGAFDTATKELIQGLVDLEIRSREETIQTTALSRSARILSRVLEICCLSNSSEKPTDNAGVKNSQKSKMIKMMMIRKFQVVLSSTNNLQAIILLRLTKISTIMGFYILLCFRIHF